MEQEKFVSGYCRVLDCSRLVEVILSDDGSYLPKAVTLWGDASIVKRTKLIQEVAEDLGLTKEDVQWTGGT